MNRFSSFAFYIVAFILVLTHINQLTVSDLILYSSISSIYWVLCSIDDKLGKKEQ